LQIVLFSAKHAAELRGYLSSSRWRLHMVPSAGTASSSTADAEPEGAGKGKDLAAASISLPRLRVVTAAGANSVSWGPAGACSAYHRIIGGTPDCYL